MTPHEKKLHAACEAGNTGKIKALLKGGNIKNLNTIGEDGMTPLLLVLAGGYFDLAHVLIDHGADVNDIGGGVTGNKVIHFIVLSRDPDLLKKCLEKGADPDASMNAYARTPLQLAMKNTLLDMALLLLEYGADPNIENDQGFTALSTPVVRLDPGNCDEIRKTQAAIRKYDGYFINHGHEDVASSVEMNLRDLEKIIPEVADYRRRERKLSGILGAREIKNIRASFDSGYDVSASLMFAAHHGGIEGALRKMMKDGNRPALRELLRKNKDDISVLDVLKRRNDLDLLLGATGYWCGYESELKQLWQEHLHPWQRKRLSDIYENLCESVLQHRIRSRVKSRKPLPLRRPRP